MTVHEHRVGGFTIGLSVSPGPETMKHIVALCNEPIGAAEEVLGGRRSVTRGTLSGIGPVVVKHYARGGILGRIIFDRYIRIGAYRSKAEFNTLLSVRGFGVQAPEPLAYGYEGRLLYRAWLVTREIPNAHNLADLAIKDDPRVAELTAEAMRQVALLISHGVFHVDLHPGNVLVDGNGVVYLIDFDKARPFHGPKNALRDHYLCRWRRAVIKHELPEILSEAASLRLRERFE